MRLMVNSIAKVQNIHQNLILQNPSTFHYQLNWESRLNYNKKSELSPFIRGNERGFANTSENNFTSKLNDIILDLADRVTIPSTGQIIKTNRKNAIYRDIII